MQQLIKPDTFSHMKILQRFSLPDRKSYFRHMHLKTGKHLLRLFSGPGQLEISPSKIDLH